MNLYVHKYIHATLSNESLQTRTSTHTGLNNVTFPELNPCLQCWAGTTGVICILIPADCPVPVTANI